MSQSPLPPQSSRRQVLRAGLLAALGSVVATEMLSSTRVAASTRITTESTRVSLVGDSLTEGTLPYQADTLSYLDWSSSAIDAFKSRGIRTKMKGDPHTGLSAVDAIRETNGDSDLWVVALGSNDAGFYPLDEQPGVIREMVDRIGDEHYVLWVNVYLPATLKRQRAWNASLATVAAERPHQMFVLDWATLAQENPKWLGGDKIHCSTVGYKNRASVIAQATKTLVPTDPIPRPSSLPRRQFVKYLPG
ncbi:MAG TPA: GDSL-type esterase/lipase family protein [Ilumatobacteraceae bacterium]|nr:GDSL-type esterase/lipase family protein [Ilumatobacteraceae bacterium]